MYRPGRVSGTREAVVHPNYIVIYRVIEAAVGSSTWFTRDSNILERARRERPERLSARGIPASSNQGDDHGQ